MKVGCKHGVGVSNIDGQACTARGIPVFVTPGANAQSVAEMTLGLLLAAARGIAHMDGEIRAQRWTRLQNGIELKGKTLGLVGFGQVGRLVAKFCRSEEHTSELQSLMRISYAVFCLKKKKKRRRN